MKWAITILDSNRDASERITPARQAGGYDLVKNKI